MTRKQQEQYWREYARQNAIYENRGVQIYVLALLLSIRDIIAIAKENGAQAALDQVDNKFDQQAIINAYTAYYLYVGRHHRAWEFRQWVKKLAGRPKPVIEAPTSQTATFGVGFRNEEWLRRLERLTRSLDVGVRVTQVSETTKTKLREVLAEALRNEVSNYKITSFIQQRMGGKFSRQRARLIARTETTYVANVAAEEAAQEIARENGFALVKQWVATLDDRTRDTHRMVGSSRPIKSEDKFLVGGKKMDKPGDPAGGAAEVCNCRCIAAYFPADDYQDLFGGDGFIS